MASVSNVAAFPARSLQWHALLSCFRACASLRATASPISFKQRLRQTPLLPSWPQRSPQAMCRFVQEVGFLLCWFAEETSEPHLITISVGFAAMVLVASATSRHWSPPQGRGVASRGSTWLSALLARPWITKLVAYAPQNTLKRTRPSTLPRRGSLTNAHRLWQQIWEEKHRFLFAVKKQ